MNRWRLINLISLLVLTNFSNHVICQLHKTPQFNNLVDFLETHIDKQPGALTGKKVQNGIVSALNESTTQIQELLKAEFGVEVNSNQIRVNNTGGIVKVEITGGGGSPGQSYLGNGHVENETIVEFYVKVGSQNKEIANRLFQAALYAKDKVKIKEIEQKLGGNSENKESTSSEGGNNLRTGQESSGLWSSPNTKIAVIVVCVILGVAVVVLVVFGLKSRSNH